MRKSFVYAAGLMCLALSITDCQKELVDQTTPASEPNFELFAQPVTTKTANNGLDTKWVANDAINVFHAEAGSTAYDSDGRFTVKDIETGRFDGTVSKSLSADKSYDWYAFYPYTSQITTPDNTASGYCYIGSRSDASQTQTGDNNMYHICGSNYPLYGIAKNVNASDVPSIQMQHLTSVIKIVVTNSTEEELSLNSVSFTAEENISGQFYIAFNSETPKYTSAGHPSKTANLTVSDIKVAPKAKATVYMAIKPFTAKTGTTLKLAVNGYEKTLTLKNDITFTAGHIKPLNFNFDKKVLDSVTLPWSIDGTGGSSVWKNTVGLSQKGLVGSDYGDINKPYLTKLDADGDYVQVKYDSPASFVKFAVKMIGGKNTSYMTVQGSAAGQSFTDIEKFTISGKQNDILSFTTSQPIDTEYRYIRLLFKKGSNVGLGAVEITKESTDPRTPLATPKVQAEVRDVNSVYAFWGEIAGAKDYTITCGEQTFTTADTKYTFTNLAYSTEYTVSVVANPSDETVNTPSAAGKSEVVKTGANPEGGTVVTYQHIFTSKPKIGSNVELSNVSWTINATNLNGYNSTSYAGVQFGTSSKDGEIKLTSSSAWTYKSATKIKEIRLWLNLGGTSVTPAVTIGGETAVSDGTKVVKNKDAVKDWTKTTKVTFTPAANGNEGIVVIDVKSVNAGYICAIEIDCM